MSKLVVIFCLAALLMGGCGVVVIPQATPTATVDLIDNSITETRHGITATARVQDFEVAPYRMVNNITSFHVAFSNGTQGEVAIPLESFVLLDGEGNQYRPIPPGEIQEIIGRDSTYLIPYPYVGYYYLEDAEKTSFFNTFDSSLPYFAENYPQDIFTEALPVGAILPGAQVSGLVYFLVDLTTMESVQLRIYLPGTPATEPADFNLPFSIEKK